MIDTDSISDIIDNGIRNIHNTGLLPFVEKMRDLSVTIRAAGLLEGVNDE